MLTITSPLPDELDLGYHGCLARLNGLRKPKEFDLLARRWIGDAIDNGYGASKIEILSKLSGLTINQFVARHTTLPLRRGVTSYRPDLPHGCEFSKPMLRLAGTRLTQNNIYFCEDCVQEDINAFGRSYWRRSHQIPGLVCCPTHKSPLCFSPNRDDLFASPSRLLEKSKKFDSSWCIELMNNQAIVRYLDICTNLLTYPKPFSPKQASGALTAAKANRDTSNKARSTTRFPSFSDSLIRTFGREWLALVAPDLADKPDGATMISFDRICYSINSASSATAYALAFAALFPDVQSALKALSDPNTIISKKTGTGVELEDLKKAYFEEGGSYSKTAKRMNLVPATAGSRLETAGLPHIHNSAKKDMLKALECFINRESSLQDSAAEGGVSLDELGRTLRILAKQNSKAILRQLSGRKR